MFSLFKSRKSKGRPDDGASGEALQKPKEPEHPGVEEQASDASDAPAGAAPNAGATPPSPQGAPVAQPPARDGATEPENDVPTDSGAGLIREAGDPADALPPAPADVLPPPLAPAAPGPAAAGPDPAGAVVTASGEAQQPGEKPRASWLSRLRKGLSRTGSSIGGLFTNVTLDEALYEDLETALIMADAGVEATDRLLAALRARVRKDRLTNAAQARDALRDILADHLRPLEKPFDLQRAKPLVVMIAGVNGAGKTTSIGKLAHTFQQSGAHVLLAAGDTFRAAAREQLVEWGSRNNVTVIAQEGGDPAAVAFDAVNAGRARKCDVVMVDTAGRLPTQLHLMEELKKIRRVIAKADGDAPHEVLLVVDGNTGQNALAQIRAFDAAIGLTGLVVTKLDGTAKGGTLAAVAAGSQGVRPVPVYWIGVGEGLHDLQPFVAREFAAALIGD